MTDPHRKNIERTLDAIIKYGPEPAHWPQKDQERYLLVYQESEIVQALTLASIADAGPQLEVVPEPSPLLRARILSDARRTQVAPSIWQHMTWSPVRRIMQASSVLAAVALGVTAAYAAVPGPTPEAEFLAYAAYGTNYPGGFR